MSLGFRPGRNAARRACKPHYKHQRLHIRTDKAAEIPIVQPNCTPPAPPPRRNASLQDCSRPSIGRLRKQIPGMGFPSATALLRYKLLASHLGSPALQASTHQRHQKTLFPLRMPRTPSRSKAIVPAKIPPAATLERYPRVPFRSGRSRPLRRRLPRLRAEVGTGNLHPAAPPRPRQPRRRNLPLDSPKQPKQPTMSSIAS